MLKKDEIATETSCLNNAADDEPIFVLRAHDEIAPMMVLKWAARYRANKMQAGEFNEAREQKYLEALQLAEQMQTWRAQNGENADEFGQQLDQRYVGTVNLG